MVVAQPIPTCVCVGCGGRACGVAGRAAQRLRKVDGGAAESLNKKVQAVIQQQARHAKSVEEIVKALTGDNSQLNKQARNLGNSVGLLRRCATEHHHALLTTCQVCAASLSHPPRFIGGRRTV